MNTNSDILSKAAKAVTYKETTDEFLDETGKDIKKKRASGYWTIRFKDGESYKEAYCHKLIYFLKTGKAPNMLRFRDRDKDNLDFDNLTTKLSEVICKEQTAKEVVYKEKKAKAYPNVEVIYLSSKDLDKVKAFCDSEKIVYSVKSGSYVSKKTNPVEIKLEPVKETFEPILAWMKWD